MSKTQEASGSDDFSARGADDKASAARGQGGSFPYIAEGLRHLAIPLADLRPDPANARKHNAKNLEAIRVSLERFGQRAPVVVQARGMVVRAGNGRLEAARALGWSHLAAVVIDEESADAVAFALADNRTAELAEWDTETLASILDAMPAEDIAASGFTEGDLAELLRELTPAGVEETETPEPPAKPVSVTGDMWELGAHRLLCGDSTVEANLQRLLDGARADMAFTDPPYGVGYTGGHFHSGDVSIKRERESLAGDDNAELYTAAVPLLAKWVDGPIYTWFADTKALELYKAIAAVRGEISALIVWHKVNATYAAMGAQYKQRHEPCLYWKPKGSTLRWVGPSDECTVWDIKRDGRNEFHPTQKPVELAYRAIQNHEAATVLDIFGGSGSTLMAAELARRRAYVLEINPAYVDVIVKRWELASGKEAVHSGTGKSFRAIAAERLGDSSGA